MPMLPVDVGEHHVLLRRMVVLKRGDELGPIAGEGYIDSRLKR